MQLDDLDFADDLALLSHTKHKMQGKTNSDISTRLGLTDIQDGTDADVKVKTGKASAAFYQQKNIWVSSDLPLNINIRIFNFMVKPVLLYGAETWRTTENSGFYNDLP